MRHGISGYNLQRRVQGHCDDSTLSDQGRETARLVGLALQGLPLDAVYSSPLQRARETADIILKTVGQPELLQTTDLLKEINLVQWEGMAFDEVERQFPEDYLAWRDRPHQLKMQMLRPDGSSVEYYPVLALFDQAREFWKMVLPQSEGKTILVVAHSGINRALISTAVGLSPERYHSIYQTNCGISVLNFAAALGDPVQIESMNVTAPINLPLPKLPEKMNGPRLLLVRHGETQWNREKRFQGQIDVPLNEQGRVQAEKAEFFLREIRIDRAVSSPMARPKETAEIILRSHPHVTLELDERLVEIAHGLWEGKLEEEIAAEFGAELAAWKQSPETVQMPEGENLQQVWQRAIAAWEAIVASAPSDRPSTILVVAHDAINKAILCYLAGFGPEQFWVFKQGNGAVSVIDYPKGAGTKPIIQALNITTHLGGVLDKTAAGAL